jgi:hypothetical protein
MLDQQGTGAEASARRASVYESGDQIIAETSGVDRQLGGALFGGATWDLAPDGKRVAVLAPVESEESPKQEYEVVFLMNFFDELRRRLPTGK